MNKLFSSEKNPASVMVNFSRVFKSFRYIRCLINPSSCDKYTNFSLLTALAGHLLPSYKFNWPEIEWWNDDEFNRFLMKFDELNGFNCYRRWTLKQLLRLTAHVDGDTAECGVFRGSSSYLILLANKNSTKTNQKVHHIFDSFEGLSDPSLVDGNHWSRGDLSISVNEVISNLSPFTIDKDFLIYQGWIPDRFDELNDREFSFVHVDVDLYQPTIDSFRFFYPRLKKGGILLCDDYGFDTCPGVKKAVEEYFENKPEQMLALPDGGGFIIKGTPVLG
jgi:O-methyltransferase